MRVGEALSRCPELVLVAADPARTEDAWERALRRLEAGLGAEVESGGSGEAFFELGGLRALWGGAAGVLSRAREELGSAVRLAAAPGRFCSYAAATRARRGGHPVIPEGGARRFLSPLPVSLLHGRRPDDDLPNELERLGVDTLGRLAALPLDAVADRFGRAGIRARALARGEDIPLRPRPLAEALAAELELPDAVSGPQLERALELLIARLLAHPERRGRMIRALRLSARLAGGGGWRRELALRTSRCCPGRPLCWGCGRSRWEPPPASSSRWQTRTRTAGAGCPRRCTRPAPRGAARRCCGCSRLTPTPGCPSAGRC
jgi:protein ImuB